MVIAMKNRMEQINMLLEQDGMEVSLQERFKNNQLKQGMVLRSKEFNCSPVIYVDEKFWELSDLEIAEQLKQSFEKYSFNMEHEFIRKKIYRQWRKRELHICIKWIWLLPFTFL